MKPSPARHLEVRALFAAMVFVFSATHSSASESEVAVTGCVVDFGGKRYKNIDVTLKGVTYRGGAGYADNNSVTLTDGNGEFVVRMKAGEPPPGEAATARLRATVERQWGVHGWSGRASDVAQEINVSNIGKPVDLRPQGCLRYPWPISVGGVISSEELDEGADKSFVVRFTAGGSSDRLSVWIPNRRGGASNVPFDLLVGLSERDQYTIETAEQPKGAYCEIQTGSGFAGESYSTVEGTQSHWITNSIRINCVKRKIEEDQEKLAALPRRGGNSGSAVFQDAINQAAEDARDPSARLAREREASERAAAALALRQQQASQSAQNVSEGLAVLGQVLGAIGQYKQANQAGQQNPLQLLALPQAPQRQAPQPINPEHGRIYYPPLGCASVTSVPYGNKTIPTMKNNCGRAIEAHFSGGMWTVGTGQSYSYQTNTVFYAACEKSDSYDRSTNQCRR